MKAEIYNESGKKSGEVTLPADWFEVAWNADLVHQVAESLSANARQNLAHAKDRSEVRGGGKKPWRQKGTGRARHGSRRSPIWVGGGVTHGPGKERDYSKKINKKMRSKALAATLSKKMADGEVIFVDSLSMSEPKTKDAAKVLAALAKAGFPKLDYKTGNRALVLTPEMNEAVFKSFDNIKSAEALEMRNLNTLGALSYKYLVVVDPEKSLKVLENRVK